MSAYIKLTSAQEFLLITKPERAEIVISEFDTTYARYELQAIRETGKVEARIVNTSDGSTDRFASCNIAYEHWELLQRGNYPRNGKLTVIVVSV